jgi:hypothetical protein
MAGAGIGSRIGQLFGFEFVRKRPPEEQLVSFATKENEDGAVVVAAGGAYGTYVDLDGSVRTEAELVTKYREMSLQPECDAAVDEIINETISIDEDIIVDINLDKTNCSDSIKKVIREEFDGALRLLDFNKYAYDIFRRWYIDGRLYYHVVIDVDKPQDGIKELRYVDPRKIRKIREVAKKRIQTGSGGGGGPGDAIITRVANEYYIYNDKGFNYGNKPSGPATNGLKIAADAVLHIVSGLTDNGGTMVLSYLHKGIKALNQLRTLEDALVIYRLARAPERRIWYIDVGNLPKIKAEQYVREMMVKHKNRLIYDAACLALDTKISLLDGRTLTLSEMINEHESGKINWVYSHDPVTGKFAPGLVSWAGVTRKDEKVVRITLDNDKSFTVTLDHKFPVWNKGKVEAKDLQVGDSMIPLYRRKKSITSGRREYEQIFDNVTKKWIFTHRAVSSWKDDVGILNEYNYLDEHKNSVKKTIHHKNINGFDNSPDNLTRMNRDDHFAFHHQFCSEAGKIGGKVTAQRKREKNLPMFNMNYEQRAELGRQNGLSWAARRKELGILPFGGIENMRLASKLGNTKLKELLATDKEFHDNFCASISAGWGVEQRERASVRAKNLSHEHFVKMSKNGNTSRWADEVTRKEHSSRQTILYTKEIIELVKKCAIDNYSVSETIELINVSIDKTSWKELNTYQCIKQRTIDEFTTKDLSKVCVLSGFVGFKPYRNALKYNNHKIIKIEFIDDTQDVGTLTIDKYGLYHDYHTFALDAGISTCNSGEVRDDRKFMTMLEDYWLPRREGGRGTEVTTLPGGQTLGQMDDVLYFQKKFLQTLNVPVSRLNSDALFSVGRATEITRDEIKFARFITRLRNRFAVMFTKLLEKQLVLKQIMTIEDWTNICPNIKYDFSKDNYFTELKDAEILQARHDLAATFQDLIGKYYSHQWVREKLLQQTEEDIEKMDKEIEIEDNSEEPRWINPAIEQNVAMKDQLEMQAQGIGPDGQPTADGPPGASGAPAGPGNAGSGGASPEKEKYESVRQAKQTVEQIERKKENRTMQDESKYKAAVQVLAKNPELAKSLGISKKK